MSRFSGFPRSTRFTPVPDAFFSVILPQLSDIAELKLTLHIFRLLYRKRGYPRFTTYGELAADKSLVSSLASGEKAEEVLQNALSAAIERGTILHLVLKAEHGPEDVYFLNTESDRQIVARIQNGELALAGLKAVPGAVTDTGAEPSDIFSLYEQNIGMLTPIIADELREAENLYPKDWIRDAIKEAVNNNKRKWSYISAILERWLAEGKTDGTYRRDSKKAGPDRFEKQRYGNMAER